MINFIPNVNKCPEDIQGNAKLVMNVIINASEGRLGPLTIYKIGKYSQLDQNDLSEAINELALKNLIRTEEWV